MKQRLLKSFLFFSFLIGLFSTGVAKADCKNQELRRKVAETAKAEGVDEKELLSIIAHESKCNYFAIAWNLPRRPETARSKFFDSLEEAKSFAEELISTRKYRVDIGIGQINNEAHLRPKGWTLEEILDPKTALNRVAFVLRERGWSHYHSNNPVLARKWQGLALAALSKVLGGEDFKGRASSAGLRIAKGSFSRREKATLLVFNPNSTSPERSRSALEEERTKVTKAQLVSSSKNRRTAPLLVFNRERASPFPKSEKKEASSWVIYGNL